MPKRQNPHLKGDLVIRFGVDFPESIPEATAARLANAFEGPTSAEGDVQEEAKQAVPPTPERKDGEVYLSDFDMDQFGKSLQKEAEAYDQAEEEEQARAAAMAAAAKAAHSRRHSYSNGGYG